MALDDLFRVFRWKNFDKGLRDVLAHPSHNRPLTFEDLALLQIAAIESGREEEREYWLKNPVATASAVVYYNFEGKEFVVPDGLSLLSKAGVYSPVFRIKMVSIDTVARVEKTHPSFPYDEKNIRDSGRLCLSLLLPPSEGDALGRFNALFTIPAVAERYKDRFREYFSFINVVERFPLSACSGVTPVVYMWREAEEDGFSGISLEFGLSDPTEKPARLIAASGEGLAYLRELRAEYGKEGTLEEAGDDPWELAIDGADDNLWGPAIDDLSPAPAHVLDGTRNRQEPVPDIWDTVPDFSGGRQQDEDEVVGRLYTTSSKRLWFAGEREYRGYLQIGDTTLSFVSVGPVQAGGAHWLRRKNTIAGGIVPEDLDKEGDWNIVENPSPGMLLAFNRDPVGYWTCIDEHIMDANDVPRWYARQILGMPEDSGVSLEEFCSTLKDETPTPRKKKATHRKWLALPLLAVLGAGAGLHTSAWRQYVAGQAVEAAAIACTNAPNGYVATPETIIINTYCNDAKPRETTVGGWRAAGGKMRILFEKGTPTTIEARDILGSEFKPVPYTR